MRVLKRLSGVLILVLVSYVLVTRLLIPAVLERLRPSKPLWYECPERDFSVGSTVAPCQDCTLYPLDKRTQLAPTYRPALVDTRLAGGGKILSEAAKPLRDLFAEAVKQGHDPVVTSAYRSYDDQALAFSRWLTEEWRSSGNPLGAYINASRYSALPGHSEHQLGSTLDINCKTCVPFDDQDDRNLALWEFLESSAHRYGFVLSYPRGSESRTGYQHEPWHVRYVGIELATELYQQQYAQGSGVCLNRMLELKKLYR